MLHYKGYAGQIEIDTESGILFGRVLDIRDVVTFKGETVNEAKQAFEDSVDDYLEFCQSLGQEPNKPFSGKLPFRTTPERHHKIFITASKAQKSINAWMDEVLVKAAVDIHPTPLALRVGIPRIAS
jgi:predicted HicB family RNase H-like nuclease